MSNRHMDVLKCLIKWLNTTKISINSLKKKKYNFPVSDEKNYSFFHNCKAEKLKYTTILKLQAMLQYVKVLQ
jgi:hypothetical protein